jgi:signal transduction histidine kinase
MPKFRLHLPRRHLLALCTFLVPLGALAWLQQSELRRQGAQAQVALQREAMQFLGGAAQAIENQFDRKLPQLGERAADLITFDESGDPAPAAALARAARRLRDELQHPAVRDLVLLDTTGHLRAPQPALGRVAPPLARDPDPNSGFGRSESRQSLRFAELLIGNGRLDDAETVLTEALAAGQGRRRDPDLELQLNFRLATLELHRGEPAAEEKLRRVRDEVDRRQRSPRQWPMDADTICCGLFAELLLAEKATEVAPRLQLLGAITSGRRDALDETALRWVGERAAAGVSAASSATAADRTEAAEQLRDLDAHLQARAFALDYETYLQGTVNQLLANRGESASGAGDPYKVFSLAGHSSVLVLHPLQVATGAPGGWLGIHLDLNQLLANSLDDYVRGNGSLVLAIADSEYEDVLSGPRAPDGFEPPEKTCCTLLLRAYPADVDRWLHDAAATANASALLAISLFVVAVIGALLLWRSVSRESELATMKVDLMSRVSHELKTPLSLISLYGETLGLKRARDADQAAQFGRIIARESERLTGLIQRILDFSRQQAGTLRYEPKDVELGPLLAEVAAAYAPHLEAKGASLATELQSGVCAQVDGPALAGVLVNLLENAIKYAREEDPDRSLRLELRAENGAAVVDVLDRGRGVPPGERERVFESFYRASNAGEVRGAGLGLSLVRHFVHAHGGTAVVLARDGGGSIFRITLPTTQPLTSRHS